MAYAAGTEVPVERSRNEIEWYLGKYGADQFFYGAEATRAFVAFRAQGRGVRFVVPIPPIEDFRKTVAKHPKVRTPVEMEKARAAEIRRRWRALALAVKAKLEAVSSGIASFETEFMPYTMLADGRTVAEAMGPEVERAIARNVMPRVAGYLPAPAGGGE